MYNDTAFVWHAGHFHSFPAERTSYLGDSYKNIATSINSAGTAAGVDGEYTRCSMSGLELKSAVTYNAQGVHFVDGSRDGLCSFEADSINDRGRSSARAATAASFGTPTGTNSASNRCRHGPRRTAPAQTHSTTRTIVGGTTADVANVPKVNVSEETPYCGSLRPVYVADHNAYVIHAFLLTVRPHARAHAEFRTRCPVFPTLSRY